MKHDGQRNPSRTLIVKFVLDVARFVSYLRGVPDDGQAGYPVDVILADILDSLGSMVGEGSRAGVVHLQGERVDEVLALLNLGAALWITDQQGSLFIIYWLKDERVTEFADSLEEFDFSVYKWEKFIHIHYSNNVVDKQIDNVPIHVSAKSTPLSDISNLPQT